MKIISKFKDYYDWIANIYGTDKSIVYNRNTPIVVNKVAHKGIPFLPRSSNYYTDKSDYHFKFLVICGKLYVVAKRNEFNPIYGVDYFHYIKAKWELVTEEHPASYVLSKNRFGQQNYFNVISSIDSNNIIALSVKVGAPVFTFIERNDEILVDQEVPNLAEIGVASRYSPEQIYQDISYFICNILKESPDLAPPSKITDNEKIVSHGFDLKQSFRHRK